MSMWPLFRILLGVISLSTIVEASTILEPKEWSLGLISPEAERELVFELRNNGDQPAAVERLWSGCGCVVARMDTPVILAGSSQQVRVRFTAPRAMGPVDRDVHVQLENGALLTAQFSAVVGHLGGREAADDNRQLPEHVPGRILVRYRSDRCQLPEATASADLRALATQFKCEQVRVVQRELNLAALELAESESVEAAIARLSACADVLYAQPDYILGARGNPPDDPSFANQWNLFNDAQGGTGFDVGALEGWNRSIGTGSIIAILDSGVDYTHPDMAGRMWDGSGCLDEHGNDVGNCIHGWDYSGDGDADPAPSTSDHGTHVAGIAGAATNNATDISGLAYGAKIMAVRSAFFTESEFIQGIYFAKYNGADVINASWGWSSSSCAALMSGHQALYDACAEFPGVMAVAAGNESRDHNGTNWFDTANFGQYVRGSSAATAMSIERMVASQDGSAVLLFGDSGHTLTVATANSDDAEFSILLAAGATTNATWHSSSRRLEVTFVQGGSTASQLVSTINSAQVSVRAGLGEGDLAGGVRLRLEGLTAGGRDLQRARWLYENPLDPSDIRLAIETLVDGSSGNDFQLVLRDTGAVTGNDAVANRINDRVVEVDVDFGMSSSDAIANAVNGILVAGDRIRIWPALCFRPLENVISVTSYGEQGQFLHDYGQNIDVAAPGKNIRSLNLGSGTTLKTGTSMAAPHVAAAAAMALSVQPGLTPGQVREAIKKYARCTPHGGRPLATSGNGYCADTHAAQLDVGVLLQSLRSVPIGVDDAYTVAEDQLLIVADPLLGVLANDTDGETGSLTAVLDVGPSHGTLTLNDNGTFSYLPNSNFFGADSFSYFVWDGSGSSILPGVVTLTVDGVNDLPVGQDDMYVVAEDGTLVVSAPGVLANDLDVDSPIAGRVILEVLYGTLSFFSNGAFVYEPLPNFFGVEVFTYLLYQTTDNVEAENASMVTIEVEAVNDPPEVIALVESISVEENGAALFELLAKDVDDDGGNLGIFAGSSLNEETFVAVGTGVLTTLAGATVEVTQATSKAMSDGGGGEIRVEFVYHAPPRTDCSTYRGPDAIYLQVRDDGGGRSAPVLVEVEVKARVAPWYPALSWSDGGYRWYQIEIIDTRDEVVFLTRLRGTQLLAKDYQNAGFRGLLPGEYDVFVTPWDPVWDELIADAGIVVDQADLNVAYEPAAHFCVPEAAVEALGYGRYRASIGARGARGVDVILENRSTGEIESIRRTFPPMDTGIMLWENRVEVDFELSAAGDYHVYARGFNPIDEFAGLPSPGDELGRTLQELTTEPITFAVANVNRPDAPRILLPHTGEVFSTQGADERTQVIQWQAVPGVTQYYLYLSAADQPPVMNFEDVGRQTELSVTLSPGTYSMMVVGVNEHAANPVGPWSEIRRFRVVTRIENGIVDDVTYGNGSLTLSASGASILPSRVRILHYGDLTGSGAWRELGDFAVAPGGLVPLGENLPQGINYFRISPLDDTGEPLDSNLFQLQVPPD